MFSYTLTYEKGTYTLSLLTREEKDYMTFRKRYLQKIVTLKKAHTQNQFV
jgi:hypothetical protein